jgi:hypothetical protein
MGTGRYRWVFERVCNYCFSMRASERVRASVGDLRVEDLCVSAFVRVFCESAKKRVRERTGERV